MSMLSKMRQKNREKCRRIVRQRYHEEGWISPYKKYQATLSDLLGESTRVLDVGCGREFPMAPRLLATGAEVHGIDPVGDTDHSPPGVTLRRGSAEHIPYDDETFDVVTSCAVLEHLQKPVDVFTEFGRVLKRTGRVVFLTPGRYDYVSVIARLVPNRLHGKLVEATEGRQEADTFPTFYRANSAGQITSIAQAAGMAVETVQYVNEYPYALMFSPLLCRLGILYDKTIRRFRCLHWLQGWMLGVLRRREN